VYEGVLKWLPPPDNQMRAAGLPGRVFPAVGNHEVWDDTDAQGLLKAFPYVKQFGVSDKRLIYKFDFNGARFIFLWTGKYDYRSPSGWDADRPQLWAPPSTATSTSTSPTCSARHASRAIGTSRELRSFLSR
jgi:hypothetical protein